MQYAWKWRMYGNRDLCLTDGRKVRIINPGIHNTSQGPDFFNAKILLDGFEWAGNIELHVKASDWWRHRHHLDPAYSNIILHVVAVNDASLKRTDGTEVPQLLFPLTPSLIELYNTLTADASLPPPLRCLNRLCEMPEILINDALHSAAFERLRQRGLHIIDNLRYLDGDLTHTAVAAIARSLGFGVNSQPFERTALRLNLNYCARHADNPMQLDALVLGIAGLLENAPSDTNAYFHDLKREFQFLAHKYSLTVLPASIWKLSGVRPHNSPYRKLAFLARLLPKAHMFVSRIQESTCQMNHIKELLAFEFDDYWKNHSNFGKPSERLTPAALSETSLHLMAINAVAPLIHALALLYGNREMEENAVTLLESLPPEKNTLIRDWERAGLKPKNAFESQGLIQLRKQYCDLNECLRCRIGNRLLRSQSMSALPVAALTKKSLPQSII